MRSSSPSKSHSTPVPIKVQHRIAKKATRRRRVDLPCGCSYFISINCHDYGFTHRGTIHCSSNREWRLYLDGQKSPLFQDNQAPQKTVHDEARHNHITSTVQLQPEESVGDTQMFSNLQNLDSFTSSDLAFLKSI
ncbi:transcription enhancer protein [Tomato yellow leaf curl China virus -[Y264]]|uniref:Transcriptional activator protein n=1 Tax=Tomato yellow leaf curl China virus TaxID=185793 RepID=B1VK79_TYLCC|nr:transcription enhancer protein [Tomato yellow leaf curl China virus -[Y264]]CAQ35103.1 AC2 protein [Tomato yellow leaf curl China virus]